MPTDDAQIRPGSPAHIRIAAGQQATVGGARLDVLYPQKGGESALLQLQVQLARPLPYDLEGTNLSEYRRLGPRRHDWRLEAEVCAAITAGISSTGSHRQPARRQAHSRGHPSRCR